MWIGNSGWDEVSASKCTIMHFEAIPHSPILHTYSGSNQTLCTDACNVQQMLKTGKKPLQPVSRKLGALIWLLPWPARLPPLLPCPWHHSQGCGVGRQAYRTLTCCLRSHHRRGYWQCWQRWGFEISPRGCWPKKRGQPGRPFNGREPKRDRDLATTSGSPLTEPICVCAGGMTSVLKGWPVTAWGWE